MIENFTTISLNKVTLICKPEITNLKTTNEHLDSFSYSFKQGKTYAIVGNEGAGGGALSYLLSGRSPNYKGEILINDKLIKSDSLKEIGWYIGEGVEKHRLSFFGKSKGKTIREQLEITQSDQYTSDELIKLFGLSPSRLDREMRYISNERWNASTAIGLALGKSLFCFPWLEDSVKEIIRARLQLCSTILKQNNCILIIPVRSKSIVEDFVDEIIYLK